MESRMEALEEAVEMLKKVTWDQGSQLAMIKTRQEELDETKTEILLGKQAQKQGPYEEEGTSKQPNFEGSKISEERVEQPNPEGSKINEEHVEGKRLT